MITDKMEKIKQQNIPVMSDGVIRPPVTRLEFSVINLTFVLPEKYCIILCLSFFLLLKIKVSGI